MINWKVEIARLVLIKQEIAQLDVLKAYPWHLPNIAASEDEIFAAEKRLQTQFPKDYKDFLRHANGWKGVLIASDLYRVEDANDQIREEIRDVFDQRGISGGKVVIGAAADDLDVFLFSGNKVIWVASDVVEEFENFEQFFLSMIAYNERVLRNIKERANR